MGFYRVEATPNPMRYGASGDAHNNWNMRTGAACWRAGGSVSTRSPHSFTTNTFASQSIAYSGMRHPSKQRRSPTRSSASSPTPSPPRSPSTVQQQEMRPNTTIGLSASSSAPGLLEEEEGVEDGEPMAPRMLVSWSGTRLVHHWALRPVPKQQVIERVRHTVGPQAWGPQTASPRPAPRGKTPEPKLQADQTRVQWIAQRTSVPEHGAIHNDRVDRREALAIKRTKQVNPEWNSRFVHGSPVLDGARRWPDAASDYKPRNKMPHRYGLRPRENSPFAF